MPIIFAWDIETEKVVRGKQRKLEADSRYRTDINTTALDSAFLIDDDLRIEDYTLSGDVIVRDDAKADARLAAKFVLQKDSILKEVDAHIEHKIAVGAFVHNGVDFSITVPAQVKWMGLYNSRLALPFPQTVINKQDTQFYDVVDATEVETMYALAVVEVKRLVDEGTAVKKAIISSTDLDEIRTLLAQYKES